MGLGLRAGAALRPVPGRPGLAGRASSESTNALPSWTRTRGPPRRSSRASSSAHGWSAPRRARLVARAASSTGLSVSEACAADTRTAPRLTIEQRPGLIGRRGSNRAASCDCTRVRLPSLAWLELAVEKIDSATCLPPTGHLPPAVCWGRPTGGGSYPFHGIVFGGCNATSPGRPRPPPARGPIVAVGAVCAARVGGTTVPAQDCQLARPSSRPPATRAPQASGTTAAFFAISLVHVHRAPAASRALLQVHRARRASSSSADEGTASRRPEAASRSGASPSSRQFECPDSGQHVCAGRVSLRFRHRRQAQRLPVTDVDRHVPRSSSAASPRRRYRTRAAQAGSRRRPACAAEMLVVVCWDGHQRQPQRRLPVHLPEVGIVVSSGCRGPPVERGGWRQRPQRTRRWTKTAPTSAHAALVSSRIANLTPGATGASTARRALGRGPSDRRLRVRRTRPLGSTHVRRSCPNVPKTPTVDPRGSTVGPGQGHFLVAGTGFEPATSGL